MSQYILEMKNITKEFPGVKALDNVNLQVEPGEIHALIGENGAGKSTLMNILYGLHRPTDGNIYVKGEKIENFKQSVFCHLISLRIHQQKLCGFCCYRS